MKSYLYIMVLLTVLIAPNSVVALKSDRDQPAIIEAEEVEMDFRTGERTYRGNVSVQQGSMKIIADELIAVYNGSKLAKATAFGNPAEFRQRPEGKDQDVVGKARKLELDQIEDLVTLNENASITQDADTIEGKTIVYSLQTEKMTVQGGATQQQADAAQPSSESSEVKSQDKQQGDEPSAKQERPRVTIQPKSTATE
ncbi:MAG: lipopolysaccharide transport periplasmic protein LptA [Gammaproteobacteria bacterium]|nr:lipopolysaccharide transport periplasmic protein LptA [Gammaproteobacteria bacterium]